MSQIALTAGAGAGRYRTIFDLDNENGDPNVFGSVAFRVFEPVNVISEWTGQDLTVGLSIQPIPKVPFVITPAFTDITGNAGDGWRFVMGAGYSFRF
ncbi:MAG: hypothetical protein HC810_05320 [Acaryochloridaceae cyanobacterium RL_2_7]|nr:hypothetical protein [Acaryochloridaceae cyanobacterium RL_2_7]